jgi:hypothetical protein
VSWLNYKPFDLAAKILLETGKAISLKEERRLAAVLPPSHGQVSNDIRMLVTEFRIRHLTEFTIRLNSN